MSFDVLSSTVNTSTTVNPHDESYRSPLTPGQIALVTIGTSFVFFISIMLIICMGEFLQYNKRKYGKAGAARKKHSATGTGYDSEVRSGSQFESSLSDYTSSFQARQSMSILDPVPSTSRVSTQLTDTNIPTFPRNSIPTLPSNSIPTLPSNSIPTLPSNSIPTLPSNSIPTLLSNSIATFPSNSMSTDELVTVPFDTSLNDVTIDCDNPCDGGNNDIVMLPLIGKQCDDILDIDGEIFCDNTESRDRYCLPADV